MITTWVACCQGGFAHTLTGCLQQATLATCSESDCLLCPVQARGWTISPIPYDVAEGGLEEGSVRVDLQLMLPSAASRKNTKLMQPQPAAHAVDDVSSSSGSSYMSSTSSISSQDGDTAAAQDCLGTVVLQVRPEAPAAAAGSQHAAAPAGLTRSSSQAGSLPCTAASGAAAAAIAAAAGSDDGDDEGLCTICYDQQATCVLMECGHGGYCWRCAHVLFARPPSECPVCRQPIMQVRHRLLVYERKTVVAVVRTMHVFCDCQHVLHARSTRGYQRGLYLDVQKLHGPCS